MTVPPPPPRRARSALTREHARPAVLREWPHAWRLAVATVCIGAFMGQLDASAVTLTYRPVQAEFHASLAGVQWTSLAYLLVLVTMLVPAGRLSDRHGRKLMYLYGFVVFSLGSLGCALSGGLWTLICARALQAVGAAMLQANSIALVATSSPANRLRSALGIQAAAQSVGLAIGPTVGGVVVSTLGWRWVFLVNLPVGVVALALGFFLLPRTRQLALSGGVGAAGFILFAATTAALLLGLSTAAGLGFRPWEVAVLLGSAVVLGAVFVSNQRRVQNPLLDLVLLLSPGVGLGLLGALGAYLVLFGPLVLVPVVLSAEGFTALHAGLVATALPAGFALGALSVNGWRPPAWSDLARFTAGSALSCAALAAAVIAPLRPGWIVAVLAVMGLGLGVAIPANNAMIMRCIPPAGSGTGGGLINMARGLGTAMGVALVTLCLHLGGIGGPHHGARLAWAVLTAASLAMVVSCRRPPATS